MANLRLLRIKTDGSTTIKAQFTHELYPYLVIENINITSNTPGINDPKILKLKIIKDVLILTIRPLTPLASYFVEFKSTETHKFKSKNGDAFLFEDGKTNVPQIFGPEDPENSIRDNLLGYLDGSVYNLDDGTIVRDIINSQANDLSRALHDIGQAKNDNYLEVLIEDEVKTRGFGPYDRLSEEGAFEVLRVGKNKTNTSLSGSYSFDSFPTDPITLLRNDIFDEKLSIGTGLSSFNGLLLTVKNNPTTILNKVLIVYQDGYEAEYDIQTFGYQIKDSRYDTGFASTLNTLEDNQFQLNQSVLETDFVLPKAGDFIYVDYEYKYLGKFIDENSITVSQVLNATREIVKPLFTQFSLLHAPIVNSNDTIFDSNGIVFLDPLSNPPFSENHQAFQNEIPFRLEGLPSSVGQYAINYETGMVFVYGAETNDGTGYFPPVATYKYRNLFDSRLDYTYNPETNELVASPLRELRKQKVKVSFNYEQVLIPNVDFKAQIHEEILNERIDNRINNLGQLSVINTPVTNVFRIYNETSGEIYTLNRFNDNAVFFSYSTPPRILDTLHERASFLNVLNEVLITNNETTNVSNLRILKILLSNDNIMSSTEDVVGSSFNSSVSFSRADIFNREIYFDAQVETLDDNLNRLSLGLYAIDYRNGVIYIGVSVNQSFDLGTINYKSPFILPNNIHLISVSNIYNSISSINGINKIINYIDFNDNSISPSSFDFSDERFLNGDTTLPYLLDDDQIMVQDDIKDVRSIYDTYDLLNNVFPINFGPGSTVSGNIITINSDGIQLKYSGTVSSGNHVVLPFISPGVDIINVSSILKKSNSQELWDNSGIITGYNLTLSGAGSPSNGDAVEVIYNVKLNTGCTPIIDYNRGDYFIDYTYLADEILVSYEYGDNVIDFRESGALNEGEQYFITYKAGALRDALLKNFGTLVDIPILNTFDTSLERELYRDSLQAALQSFTKGPTLPSMSLLVSQITKIDPKIIEAAFQVWSLGTSYLYQEDIGYTGNLELLTGKFDNGVLVKNPNETIFFPVSSNLRLEDGSLALWVLPEWNGLDNDATLTFSSLIKDGYNVSTSSIYIGSNSFNPEFDDDGNFSLNKLDENSPIGLPSAIHTQIGIFIYYDDISARWNVLAKDHYTGSGHTYSGTITSSGEVYDVKFIEGLGDLTDTLRSYTNKIDFIFKLDSHDQSSPDGYSTTDGYITNYSFDGITFMADDLHYLFDFGKNEKTNRFSLYKDGRGYLNFEVWDKGSGKNKTSYKVSADISSWKSAEKHFVGCSWRINSRDKRDELHLFIDGIEVPNIIRYGGRPISSSTDRFRTVVPEIVVGTIPKKTIIGNDLHTVAGSNIVFSDIIDFQAEGILASDTIEILELNFDTYSIVSVSGKFLTLNQSMPATLTDARFSVNKYSVVVSSEIDLAPNNAISILSGSNETEIPGLRANLPSYEISKDGSNNNVLTILGNANAGDQIVIRTLGLNHRRYRERVYIWGNTTSVLRTQLPPPINLDEAKIYRVILPLTIISLSNSTLVGPNFVSGPLSAGQPSNTTEGRYLSIRMTGGNINFGTPATVVLHGTTQAGPIVETVSFTQPATKNTVQRWKTITSVVIQTTPIVNTQNSAGIEIKETSVITDPETNTIFPVIRFSYKTQNGTTLTGTGSSVVSDSNGLFADSDVGNTLVISSPAPVAGTYTISSRVDEHTIRLSPTPASFSNGVYNIYNVSIGRSGFQNGFFTLETAGQTNVPFLLPQGYYDFDYSSYLTVNFDPLSDTYAYVGSDLNGNNQAKAIIDEFRILSKQITDVRIGETLATNEISFTTDNVALREFEPDNTTLMLLRFNEFPFINEAPFYTSATKEYIQSANSVNPNFNQSVVITDRPIVYENKGYLSTADEGTIEFWVSPKLDTYNDPKIRFYFDASAAIVEEQASITNGTVKVLNSISNVISVRLATDTDNTGTDYFTVNGSIQSDFKTIKLGLSLPSQQTPVKISYIPSGLDGNRISIFKDLDGFLSFNINSNGNDFQVRQPIFWQRDTWHRVKATFRFNSFNNKDEIRLFVDGEERGIILFGTGLLFGPDTIFAQSLAGLGTTQLKGDINFTDPINNFYIGSDYFGVNIANARIDNLKISDIIQAPTLIAGQYKDINYSSNINTVFPVIEDAFTTFLLDFDQIITKVDDFGILRDEAFGIFNFDINVIDSFSIVENNAKLKQILETLILTLKPAQSKVNISYIK